MAVTLTLVGKTPGQTQFGLDTFTEAYKCDATADIVLVDASVPQKGDAHPDYPHMYLTDRHCAESGASASALDLVYMGSLTDSGGDPVLPPAQNEKDTQVMSATSSRSNDGVSLTSPLSVQYYGPTNVKKFVTATAPGDASGVDDPTDPIQVITLTIGDSSYVPGGVIDGIIARFFTPRVVSSLSAPEMVAGGRYWQNTARKTMTLSPWLFAATTGEYLAMFAPGTGYTVGNSLTITDGTYTAVISVTAIGLSNSVLAWTVTSNTFNYTTPTPIYTSGGSGSGCAFYNYHIV